MSNEREILDHSQLIGELKKILEESEVSVEEVAIRSSVPTYKIKLTLEGNTKALLLEELNLVLKAVGKELTIKQ